jgi:hypothetical protein
MLPGQDGSPLEPTAILPEQRRTFHIFAFCVIVLFVVSHLHSSALLLTTFIPVSNNVVAITNISSIFAKASEKVLLSPPTLPPATLPPATLPTATLPPATLPPATLPTAMLPPATLPPATLPPCRIAIINSVFVHYATLESIAGLFPLKQLTLPQSCDNKFLVFDFHVLEGSTKNPRCKSWVTYFNEHMKAKQLVPNNNSIVQPSIGILAQYPELPNNGESSIIPRSKSDAIIEASCYCSVSSWKKMDNIAWSNQNTTNHCVFHEKCPIMANHTRSSWLSPLYKHYYIPTLLPDKVAAKNKNAKVPSMCIVGSTERRNWGLLQYFLNSTSASDRTQFRILIIGQGNSPQKELGAYRNITSFASPDDYEEFHGMISSQCSAILMLLSTKSQPNYFRVKDSKLKLSGVVPIFIAYKIPVVLHKDHYDLFKAHMDPTVLFATHTDELENFRATMHSFLNKLKLRSF